MSIHIFVGDCRPILRTLPVGRVQAIVTSPPYWGLRDYGLPPVVWGGDPECKHEWTPRRYYTEKTAAQSSAGAFSVAGPENVARLKEGRWRQDSICAKCGAWLGSLGLEPSPDLYVEHLVEVFREARRVLRNDGTLWLNLGDSFATSPRGNAPGDYSTSSLTNPWRQDGVQRGRKKEYPGLKQKDLIMIPFRVALALQADGWWVRQTIIWSKPNGMPESVTDRPTSAHEYIFLLTKSERYFYDAEAIKEDVTGNAHPRGDGLHPKCAEPGSGIKANSSWSAATKDLVTSRNKRSVWTIPTSPYSGAHFATFPPDLVEPMIKAGTSEHGCCPKCGAPWVRIVEKGQPEARFDNPNPVLPYDAESGHTNGMGKTTLHKTVSVNTAGWRPSCQCPAGDPVPCTVLDPFFGAGTVGLVADRLGRDCIGIELNPKYVAMAEGRIKEDAPLLTRLVVSEGDNSST